MDSADFHADIFPLKLSYILGSPFKAFIDVDKFLPQLIKRLNNPDVAAAAPSAIAKRAVPKSLPLHIKEILPRVKEGGAFVKFACDSQAEAKDIERAIKANLKEHPIKPWFNPFRKVRTFLIRGKPWVEDLHRHPSTRLKIEFVPTSPGQQAVELSQETLYSLFRRYGKLADIIAQPTDSKDVPKFAQLQFNKVRHAIMAKNCMHGYTVPPSEGGGDAGTMLKLVYQQKRKAHWIWDWLVNHPRITIPLLLALVGTFTVAVFDP